MKKKREKRETLRNEMNYSESLKYRGLIELRNLCWLLIRLRRRRRTIEKDAEITRAPKLDWLTGVGSNGVPGNNGLSNNAGLINT